MTDKKDKNTLPIAIALLLGLFAVSKFSQNDEYELKRDRKIIIEKSEL